MKDEIISEMWQTRDQLAEKYGHDLDTIVAAMRERERHPLTGICRKRKPNKSMQADAGAQRR